MQPLPYDFLIKRTPTPKKVTITYSITGEWSCFWPVKKKGTELNLNLHEAKWISTGGIQILITVSPRILNSVFLLLSYSGSKKELRGKVNFEKLSFNEKLNENPTLS